MNIGPYCHFARREGVSAVFSGEIGSWPGIDLVKFGHDGAFVLSKGLCLDSTCTIQVHNYHDEMDSELQHVQHHSTKTYSRCFRIFQLIVCCAVPAAFVRGEEEDILHNDATWLLDFYDTFKDFVAQDVTDTALSSLAQVIGRFGAQPGHPRCTRTWGS
jgi:hypothetical protein